MTRDPTGTPGADGTGASSRPPGRRRPRASRGPQPRAVPPGQQPPGQQASRWPEGNYGTVPGFEFEGRRPQPGRDSPTWNERPAVPPGGEPPRFRYTQTVSQPIPVPPPWADNQLAMPGFEFDGPPRSADGFRREPFPAGSGFVYLSSPHPWAGDAQVPPGRPVSVQLGPGSVPQARFARPAPPRPELRSARTEWVGLLRSFVPQPVKPSWFSRFSAALEFRNAAVRVVLPVLAMIVIGVAAVVLIGADSGRSTRPPAVSSIAFPPAALAGGDFAVTDNGRGIDQTLGRVASDGDEIVAVGSQTGARIARAQFFFSPNDGGSWSMASERTPAGGPPPPGYAARLVAGGNGAWVALGPGAIWTSPDGRTWTLVSTAGLPLRPGDQISVLKRTAAGFIAAGSNVPGGDAAKASPVVFLSANGTSWQRLDAAQLGLAAGAGRVTGIRFAAVYGNAILIAGDVVTTVTAKSGRTQVTTSAAWLSGNGGTTWMLVLRPAAQGQISGEAVTRDGFVLVRPATVGGRPAVAVYRSPDGRTWTREATLSTPAGFQAGFVSGGPDGAIVSGQAGQALTAFVSANGATWEQTPALGPAAAETVSGVTLAAGGTVVVAGTSAPAADSRQPLITVLRPGTGLARVDVAAIRGATEAQLAVNGIATAGSTLVAVGGANGYPAAWTSVNGGLSWTRAAGQTPAVFDRAGSQQLTGVAYGAAGWLAVGGVTAGTAEHPVVVTSPNGATWQAADGEAAFRAPAAFTEQAAAGPGGYVIVGYQVSAGRPIAAAWWSAGLTGWRRARDASPGALDGAAAQMLAVSASSRGFVAVGWDANQPSAWISPNGQAWTRAAVPLPIGVRRAALQHVASEGDTVVAVGTVLTDSGQLLPFAASSSDGGTTWTDAALPVPSGQAFVTALTASGHGFTATGTFGRTEGHQDVVVWTSANGAAWQVFTPAGRGLSGPGIQAITALTASGTTLTGVGFIASEGGEDPVFWQSPIR
ncbi:MAG TPA: hypothetical protein VIX15_00940 [Streptosporangiaceae bacterium]